MANNSEFIEVLSPSALKDLQALNSEIVKTIAGVKEVNSNMISVKTPSGSDSAIKKLTADYDAQRVTIQKLQTQLNSLATTQQRVTTSAVNQRNATRENSVAQQILRAETDRNIRANTLLGGAYAKASAQLLILKKQAKDYAIALGETHPKTLQAVKDANDLSGRIMSADKVVGDFQRNVGNYSNGLVSGFQKVFSSVRQLAYILPGIGIAGIFSLALTPLYDFITGFKVVKDLFNIVDEQAQKFKDTLYDVNNAQEKSVVQIEALNKVVLDNTKTEKERLSAYKQLQETMPELENMTMAQAIATGYLTSITAKYIEAILARAKAEKLASLIAEEETANDIQKAKSLKEQVKWYDSLLSYITKGNFGTAVTSQRIKEEVGAREKNIAVLKKLYEQNLLTAEQLEDELKGYDKKSKAHKKERDELTDLYEREISDLERKKKLLNDIFIDDKTYIADKIRLSKEMSAIEYNIALKTFKENVRLHKDSLDLQKIDLNNFLTATEKSETESQERIAKIQKENFDNFLAYRKKYGREADAETYGQGVNFLPTDQLDEMVNSLKKVKSEVKDTKKEIDGFLKSFQEGFFSDAGLPTLFKVLNDEIAGFGDNFAVTFEVLTQIAQEAFKFISEASNANFANEYSNLEKQKEVALMFAGDSESAREEIERQSAIRRRGIARREFEAKKQQALFNIAIDTAQAIVATLARTPLPAGLPFVIATSVIGAAEAALVLSQQAPAYWMGTDNHIGGWMKINDKNLGPELVTTPDGKSRIYDGKDVMVNAPKGTKVKTAKETMDYLMFNNDLNNILTGNGIGNPKVEINQNIDLTPVINAINNKESVNIGIDKSGLNIFVGNGHQRKQDMNNRFNFKGKSV